MEKEKIQVYCPRNEREEYIYFDLPEKEDGCEEIRRFQGFLKIIATDAFLYDKQLCLLEASIYRRNSSLSKNEYIFEIWRPYSSFSDSCFFCKNDLDFFHLLERFFLMRKNAIYFEKEMLNLQDRFNNKECQ